MLSIMLTVVDDFPDYQFVIAGALSQDFLLPKFHTWTSSSFLIAWFIKIATVALVTSEPQPRNSPLKFPAKLKVVKPKAS
jgi:lipid-A-disaccharide synthase